MYTCTCCSPEKIYTEERNLYRHQRKYDPGFVEPAMRKTLAYSQDPAQCLHCTEVIPYRQYVEAKHEPKYCSRRCARLNSGSGRPKRNKKCLFCGEMFDFNSQKTFCSIQCSGDFVRVDRDRKIAEWKKGTASGGYADGALAKFVRDYLLEQSDHKCTRCGWGELNPTTGLTPLNVDHIDGDSTNHRPENLQVLCPNCHSITPTYGSLNRGNGREQRRISRDRAREDGRPVA